MSKVWDAVRAAAGVGGHSRHSDDGGFDQLTQLSTEHWRVYRHRTTETIFRVEHIPSGTKREQAAKKRAKEAANNDSRQKRLL